MNAIGIKKTIRVQVQEYNICIRIVFTVIRQLLRKSYIYTFLYTFFIFIFRPEAEYENSYSEPALNCVTFSEI